MRSYWSRVGPYPNTSGVLIIYGHTKGEGHGKMEAEIAMMQPQGKECMELPEAGRGKRSSLRDFRGSMAL